ncbi:MAG: SpoIIE family protein phosphatase [Candidatus Eisenbacteria bacterium]|nr:SpoIIE family protein phosphatase [Candidatus Eisenbacteria bacterium]
MEKELGQSTPESFLPPVNAAAEVQRVLERLNAVGTSDELAEAMLSVLAELSSAERTALFLPDRLRGTVSVVMTAERPGESVVSGRLAASEPLPFLASTAGGAVSITKDELEAQTQRGLEGLLKMRLGSALCTPVRSAGEYLGAFCAFNSSGGSAFTEAHVAACARLAPAVTPYFRMLSLRRELSRNVLEKEMLFDVGKAVGSSLDVQAVLDSILDALSRVIPYDAGGVYLLRPGSLDIETLATRGYEPAYGDKVRLKLGEGLVGLSIKEGREFVVADTKKDPRYVEARPSVRSEVVVPLLTGDSVIGAFNLESDRLNAFTDDHVDLLSAFATQAAIMIERARLSEELLRRRWLVEELKIARQIQATFLPAGCPLFEGFDVCATNISYEEVGGDYYDFVPIVEHQTGIAIADVSGKGIPASLIMASFRASLRAEIRNNYAIRTILAKVNRLLLESVESGNFVTAFYGVLDTRARVLTYSNAGHNPPILVRTDGRTELLMEGGTVLGALPGITFKERRVSFASGDLLVLYTDGVTDAMNPERDQFGQERLEELVRTVAGRDSEGVMQGIIDGVTAFRGEARLNDDLTLVVLRAR